MEVIFMKKLFGRYVNWNKVFAVVGGVALVVGGCIVGYAIGLAVYDKKANKALTSLCETSARFAKDIAERGGVKTVSLPIGSYHDVVLDKTILFYEPVAVDYLTEMRSVTNGK